MGEISELVVAIKAKLDADSIKKSTGEAAKEVEKNSHSMLSALKMGIGMGVGMSIWHQAENLVESFADSLKEKVIGKFELGAELFDTARALQVSSHELQKFRYAGKFAGLEAEEMGTALKFLQKNAVEAEQGGKSQLEAFQQLGVNVKDSTGKVKDASTLLTEVAEGMDRLPEGPERVNRAIAIFGRQGTGMLKLIGDGADELKERFKEFEEGNMALSDSFIRTAKHIDDNMKRLEAQRQRLGKQIAVALAPYVDRIIDNFVKMGKRINEVFSGANRGPLSGFIHQLKVAYLYLDDFLSYLAGKESLIGDALKGDTKDNPMAVWVERAKLLKEIFSSILGVFQGIGKIAEFIGNVIKFWMNAVLLMVNRIDQAIQVVGAAQTGGIGAAIDKFEEIKEGEKLGGGNVFAKDAASAFSANLDMLGMGGQVAAKPREMVEFQRNQDAAATPKAQSVTNYVTVNAPGGDPQKVKHATLDAMSQAQRKQRENTMGAVAIQGGS